MSDVNFLVLAAAAGIAFAFALLGVMTQWLKADEQSNALEGVVQRTLSDDARMRDVVMATSTQTSGISLRRGGSSTAGVAPHAEEAAAVTESVAADATELDKLEMYIARHLMGWGIPAIVLGLGVGWFLGSFAGALIGATIGTVVGVAAGTAVAALRRRQS